jgi:tetratricopeptide (TPR) repeat protein
MKRLDSSRTAILVMLILVAVLVTMRPDRLLAQSSPPTTEQAKWAIRIAGVVEPPELSGEPKQLRQMTPEQKEFGELIGTFSEKDRAKTEAARVRLSAFIQQHSTYSDAFFLRATGDLCILESNDYASLLRDVEMAISTHPSNLGQTIYETLTDHYSLRGKIKLLLGRQREALDDLSAAMTENLSNADSIFNTSGTEPVRTSSPCEWNLADLDRLVSSFPTDYRPLLLRGLYFQFFTRFNTEGKYYPEAAQDFDKATTINPQSPLARHFLGNLYRRASIFTIAAVSSEQSQNAIRKKAIDAYTDAIRIDPGFRPAYEERASQLLNAKEYPRAIGDYDQVLKLDPTNVIAYADRGLALFLTGQYRAAIASFGGAIRRKKDDDSTLAYSYEHRGDAYVAIRDFAHAIADYSEAIKRQFGGETILLSLQQIRALYPEYDHVADDVLLRRIHDLFWPRMDYAGFAESLSKKESKWAIGDLHELYVKRGDAYLANNQIRLAVRDFYRVFNGIPNYADSVDRWRFFGKNPNGQDQQIDVKTVRFPGIVTPEVTLKTVGKDGRYTVQVYEFDCHGKKVAVLESRVYDADDQELRSPPQSNVRSHFFTPNTQEQRLHAGVCSDQR